jgi:hypothetical protein
MPKADSHIFSSIENLLERARNLAFKYLRDYSGGLSAHACS